MARPRARPHRSSSHALAGGLRFPRAAACSGLALALSCWSEQAPAIEPRSLTEPPVLREAAEVTSVVDALDGNQGIDLHFTLGYQQSWKRAAIGRETQDVRVNPAAAGGIAESKLFDYAENVSRLNVRGDLGIYHDLGLIVRLPIILSRVSTLDPRAFDAAALDGAPGEALFSLPQSSPNRSGVEYLSVGVDWGILNQWRVAAAPTLVVGMEARFSVSEPMHACDAVRCAYPSDINRNGLGGEFLTELEPGRSESLEGNFPPEARKAGVSRGTTALELHSQISRRIGYFEPYVGASALFESANDDSDFSRGAPWSRGLPIRTGVSLGTEIMPWEVVEQFQRLSLDFRFTGTYASEGQDYSELFDVLGSSGAASYRQPSYTRYRANPDPNSSAEFPSVVDPSSERLFATGITRVQAHGAYAVRLTARWQAGEYVRFDVGGALAVTQSHLLTLGSPCDRSRSVELAAAGSCVSGSAPDFVVRGAPDPTYRPEVERPGRRFFVDTATTFDAWVGATVMF